MKKIKSFWQMKHNASPMNQHLLDLLSLLLQTLHRNTLMKCLSTFYLDGEWEQNMSDFTWTSDFPDIDLVSYASISQPNWKIANLVL